MEPILEEFPGGLIFTNVVLNLMERVSALESNRLPNLRTMNSRSLEASPDVLPASAAYRPIAARANIQRDIEILHGEGLSASEIASRIGYTSRTIRNRIKKSCA